MILFLADSVFRWVCLQKSFASVYHQWFQVQPLIILRSVINITIRVPRNVNIAMSYSVSIFFTQFISTKVHLIYSLNTIPAFLKRLCKYFFLVMASCILTYAFHECILSSWPGLFVSTCAIFLPVLQKCVFEAVILVFFSGLGLPDLCN